MNRSAVVAVVLAAAGLAMTATPAVAQDGTGAITGTVWFDRNGDQAQNAGEPGRANAMVDLFRAGALVNTFRVNKSGAYSITGLAPGDYRVVHTSADGYLSTTPREVPVTAGAQQVNFGIKGARLTVTTWHDQNGDGLKRGSDYNIEVIQPLRLAGSAAPAVTRTGDGNGTFVFDDLAADPHYELFAQQQTGPTDGLTTQNTDSVLDPATGASTLFALTAGEERTMGVGYRTQRTDIQLTGVTSPGRTTVGKPFTLTPAITNHGPNADAVVVTVRMPAGFRVTGVTGGIQLEASEPNLAVARTARLAPGAKADLVFTLVADRVAKGDMVMWAHPESLEDPKPADNERSFTAPAVRAGGNASSSHSPTAENVAHPAGKKPGTPTEADPVNLAGTGASPVIQVILASVVLAAGVALVVVLRRRVSRR
jgi:hypothetical protein